MLFLEPEPMKDVLLRENLSQFMLSIHSIRLTGSLSKPTMTEITQIHYMTQEESQLRRKCTTEETKTLPKTLYSTISCPSGQHSTLPPLWLPSWSQPQDITTQPCGMDTTLPLHLHLHPQISKSLDLSEFSIKSHISLIIWKFNIQYYIVKSQIWSVACSFRTFRKVKI